MKLDVVVKIGSMALIQKQENAIDYNVFQRLGGDLRPGMILVTSGAVEIGRLDYMHRTGRELGGLPEEDKVDYAAEAQKDLASRLGRGVRIVTGRKKGRVELEYYGMDDLNDLLEALALLKIRRAQSEQK